MPPKTKQEDIVTIDAEGNVTFAYQAGSDFEPVPAGEYDLIVQNVEVKQGKDSGKDYFAFEFRISDENEEYDNKPIWENISPVARWRVTQLLESVYGAMDVEEDEEVEFNLFDLFGAKVVAQVGQETNNKGRVVNNIGRFLSDDEGENLEESVKPPAAKKKAPAKRKTTRKAAAKK